MLFFWGLSLSCQPGETLKDAGGRNVGQDAGLGDRADAGVSDTGPNRSPIALPSYEQRAGDPAAGYTALLNEGYVGCGLPESAYNAVLGNSAPEEMRLPGRMGRNETLPYDQTQFVDQNGVSVITANCLFCHAAPLPGPGGEIVIGLGNANLDFTTSQGDLAELAGLLIGDPLEREAWEKWRDRIVATSPYLQTRTVGVNPADNLASILFAHRDQETLAWSETPLLEPPATEPTPTDVPPWWGMKNKNVMFYTGSGHGDHARIQMTASTLCVDSVAEAQAIDSYFNDVRAFIASLEPPAFPGSIDQDLAASGQVVFENRCAFCHGTYGESGQYPNLLIPVAEVGTDDLLATSSENFAARFVDWFNGSFYGETASLQPAAGYVAAPLDGIWATAPYLHNASVPSLALLLDSTLRPTYFARFQQPELYDLEAVGWPFVEYEVGHDELPSAAERKTVYDTTLPGYGNLGHLYGDALSIEDREAVIEYLKTL